MLDASRAPKRVLILGAGFAGAEAARAVAGKLAPHEAAITVVNAEPHALFTPLLHEAATGGIGTCNAVEPLASALPKRVATVVARALRVRTRDRIVETTQGEFAYDVLVLALGSRTADLGVPGVREYALGLKTIADADALYARLGERVREAARTDDAAVRAALATIVVCGAGPTGVELALELVELFRVSMTPRRATALQVHTRVVLVDRGPEPLVHMHPHLRQAAREALHRAGIELMLSVSITSVTAEGVSYACAGGRGFIPARTVVWCAGISPADIALEPEVPRGPNGTLVARETLQVVGHADVFVAGDLAAVRNAAHRDAVYPALAQVASAEGRVVGRNVAAFLRGEALVPFRMRLKGELVSLGRWKGAGMVFGVAVAGPFAWWLWRTVYLAKMPSWRKRLRVARDWTIGIVRGRRPLDTA